MVLSFVLKVVCVCVFVFLRDSGREFQTVGPKTEKGSFPKGLKREARNCQQSGVKRAQRPRGIVWMKRVRNLWWYIVLIGTLKTKTINFVLNPSLHWKPVECSGQCCCTCMPGITEDKSGCMIKERYSHETWIRVHIEGSAINAVGNGGAGILKSFPGGQIAAVSVATCRHCTNIKAKMEVLMQADPTVQESERPYQQGVFLSDAFLIFRLWKIIALRMASAMQRVCRHIAFQWIRARCGIPGIVVVCWLLNVPATCECISGTDLLRQLYVLPHWDRSCRPNFPSCPVTVYWHRANQFQHWPYNARRLAG